MRLTSTTTAAAIGVAALGGALALTGGATAAQQDRATGGGQIMVGDGGGAGDTIAFTARGSGEDARGQVQYVDREGGTGQGQTVHHGVVSCLYVDDNTARIAGEWRDGGPFYLYVQDNGEGDGSDVVALTQMSDGNCADDPQDSEEWALARGNAQVHDADGGSGE